MSQQPGNNSPTAAQYPVLIQLLRAVQPATAVQADFSHCPDYRKHNATIIQKPEQ